MNRRDRLVVAAIGALVATACGFVVMGFSRGFVGYRTARLLATPFVLLAVCGVLYGFSVSVLVAVGVLDLE